MLGTCCGAAHVPEGGSPCRACRLARRRLPLVPQRPLVAQAGRHARHQPGQPGRADHRSTHRRPGPVHRLLHVHGRHAWPRPSRVAAGSQAPGCPPGACDPTWDVPAEGAEADRLTLGVVASCAGTEAEASGARLPGLLAAGVRWARVGRRRGCGGVRRRHAGGHERGGRARDSRNGSRGSPTLTGDRATFREWAGQ